MPVKWLSHNGATVPKDPESEDGFSIIAPPKTDIWRRSDEDDVFTAPMVYQKMKASQFKKVEVTVFAPWQTQYDQGGLILSFPSTDGSPQKWIKAGIEYFSTQAVLGIVGTDRFSDWSLSPMSAEHHQKAHFVFEREDKTLWVYAKQEGGEKLIPMREIKWAFMEGRDEAEIWVGVYAAKPTAEEGTEGSEEVEKKLEVMFTELAVERED